MKRQRGRSRNNKNHNNNNHNNNPNRALDSNGPDVKVRGTANTIYEKYVSLANDAQSSGNRVKAENMRQHAEHYLRLVNVQEAAKQAAREEAAAAAAIAAENQAKAGETDNAASEERPRRQSERPRKDGPKHNHNKKELAQTNSTQINSTQANSTQTAPDHDLQDDRASNGKAPVSAENSDESPRLEESVQEVKPKRRRKAPNRTAEPKTSEAVDAAQ